MAACAMTGLSVSAVLEDFGQFIVPSLMRMYGHLLNPEWKAIDVIDCTEGTVHAVVRVKNSEAKPPKLKTKRLSPNEVLLVYTSPRQMCGLAIGIGAGLGRQFGEKVVADQTACMHKGATRYEILLIRDCSLGTVCTDGQCSGQIFPKRYIGFLSVHPPVQMS